MTHSRMYHLLKMMIAMLMSRAVARVICVCWYKCMDVFLVAWTPCMMKLINNVFVGVYTAPVLNLFCLYHVFLILS
jgi:hypothetical protein